MTRTSTRRRSQRSPVDQAASRRRRSRETGVDRLVIEALGRATVWLTDRGAFRMDLTERSSLAN